MSLGHENRYIDALHKNIAFLQNELAERNKMINSIMETQTAVLDVMTTTEYSRTEHSRPSITKTISLQKQRSFKRRATHKKSISWKAKENNVHGNSS